MLAKLVKKHQKAILVSKKIGFLRCNSYFRYYHENERLEVGLLINKEHYVKNGYFVFEGHDDLADVCDAPTDKAGIYLVFALKDNTRNLIYIGRSGRLKKDGTMFIRKSGLGGLKDRIVNGKQFGERRSVSWPRRMQKDRINKLIIHWYVTHNEETFYCPKKLEKKLLVKHRNLKGERPKWNKQG